MKNERKTVVRAEALTKTYVLPAEEVVAVDGLNLKIDEGDFVSLMGPSGSGKTTLLDLIGCLDSVTSGSLMVLGSDVSNARENDLVSVRRGAIGFVFQNFLLIPELTAAENVQLPSMFARSTSGRDEAVALLEQVGLADKADRLPKELSGGERQRVAIARSLASSTRLLLADEPTGNLDSANSDGVFSVFERLNAENGLTVVLATHDGALGSRTPRSIRMMDGAIVEER